MSHLSHRPYQQRFEEKRNPWQRFLDEDDVAARDAALEAAMQKREMDEPVYQIEEKK